MMYNKYTKKFINNNIPNLDFQPYFGKKTQRIIDKLEKKLLRIINYDNYTISSPTILKLYEGNSSLKDHIGNIKDTKDILSKFDFSNYKHNINLEYIGLYNDFMSVGIIDHIEHFLNKKIEIEFIYCKLKIQLTLIYSNNKPKQFIIDCLVKRIYFLLSIVPKSSKLKDILRIKIFLTKFKKKFNLSNTKISPYDINSGCTLKYHNKMCEIFIWRIEECEKVLLHELIHALDIDYINQSKYVLDNISNHFDILDKKYINLFEAYTETWAVILNVIFNCYQSSELENIYKYLFWESYFSMVQSAKILRYFGYEKFSDCTFYCKKGFNRKNFDFNQETSVLSYYILKSVILYNLEDFLTFCTDINPKEPWIYKSSDIHFYHFIKNCLDNTNYIDIIDKILVYNHFKMDSLKMVLFEIIKS